MTLRRARSIDALHTDVTDADVVLSTEAPLTLALDRRVQTPRVGRLAATPRSHASGELVPNDTRALFHTLITETNLSYKQVSRALDICLDCWNRMGTLDSITEFEEFDTLAIRTTRAKLEESPSSYRTLANTELSAERDIAVIDEASFTALDRGILPSNGSVRHVSPFHDEEVPLPEVHLYSTATDIVEALLDQLTESTAEQVGVVLDQGSIYSPLLEAGLESRGIPFRGGPGFIETDTVRQFVRLLQTSFTGSGLQVGQLRPLLAALDEQPTRKLDQHRIDVVLERSDSFPAFETLRQRIQRESFDTALQEYERVRGVRLSALRTELEALELLEKPVTEAAVNDLVYYLQTIEVPVEDERAGVLLTDGASTAYVDRPVVFYLGVGQGWAQQPPNYPWVDAESFTERDIRRFELLLQNGRQRYFLVQDSRAGEDVLPCAYFQDLADGQVERFTDLEHIRHNNAVQTTRSSPFSKPSTSDSPAPIKALSKSTLNRLVNSPRDHYFHRLVDSPELVPMVQGNVLHEAAEVYVNEPLILDHRREELIEAMVERLEPLMSDSQRPLLKTRLEIGLEVVAAYLDANKPEPDELTTYDEPGGDNELAAVLGVTIESELTERWFRNHSLGGLGIVDLLQNEKTLVDYKTGKMKSAKDIQDAASIEEISSTPDFQVLLYLAHHRNEQPGEEFQFRFVYLLGAVEDMLKGAEPILDELITTLTYFPGDFSDFVARRDVFDILCETKYQAKILEKLGYEWYRSFFERHELPQVGVAPEERQQVKEQFDAEARKQIGDYAYVKKATDGIFADLEGSPAGYYLRTDVEAFEEFVHDRLTELNQYRASRFPVSFDGDEPNWSRVNHRDLILTGEEVTDNE